MILLVGTLLKTSALINESIKVKYILSVKAFSWFPVAVPPPLPSIPPPRAWRHVPLVPPCTLRPCLQYDYICTSCTSVRCTVNSLSTVCTEYIELCSVHTFIYTDDPRI